MSTLIERSLLDMVSFIVDNRGRTCPTAETGFPLIATNCLKEDQRNPTFENVRYVDSETYSTWFRSHPEPGDVLFVCKGSPGRVAIVPDPVSFCIAQDMVALRADPAVANPGYLYYRLRAADVRSRIENMHVGTMIPHFKKGDFGHLYFPVHESLQEQQAISDVLGALDDRIATNERANRLSCELADSVFARAVNGISYGNLTFDDIAHVGGGGTPRTTLDEYWNGDVWWATPTDVTPLNGPYLSRTGRAITEDGLAACSSPLYPVGSILMTSRATIGAFAVAQMPLAVNQGFIVVNAKEPSLQWWLFHEMRSRVHEFLSHANGATFLELSRGRFKKLPVRMPTDDQAEAFAELADPLHRSAAQAHEESRQLASTRDELLPLLMSGKVRVKDAEAAVSKVV